MTITYAVGQRLTASLLQTLADYTVNRPLVRLVQQSAQTMVNSTETVITFGTGSEVVDTHGYHDETTNNTRVTPQIAGWYELRGTVYFSATNGYLTLQAQPRLNGVNYATADRQIMTAAASSQRAVGFTPVMVLLNGSTDYVELMGLQTSAANQNTYVVTSQASVFEVEFIRPA